MAKKKHKRKKQRAGQVVVIKMPKAAKSRGADALASLLGQVVVGGAIYGVLAYAAANRRRPSVAGFVARHPSATLELATIKANQVGADLVTRAKEAGERLRGWWAGRTSPEARPPDINNQLTYKPGSVGRGDWPRA
jgi:hypothetical protein